MIILASTSNIRQTLLKQAGIVFTAVAPSCDEDALKIKLGPINPKSLAQTLALAKAESVSVAHPTAIIIGSDQTLDLHGQTLNKPHDLEDARKQLEMLRGQTHTLHSAIAIKRGENILFQTVSSAHLTMRDFSDRFLSTYLDLAGPEIHFSLGGYQLEYRGVQLFDDIDGDYFSILGLPLLPLLAFLRKIGELPE